MGSMPNSGAVQQVTSYSDFKLVSQKLHSFPDKVWYEEGPFVNTSTPGDQCFAAPTYPTSNRSSISQYSQHSPKSVPTRTFYYPASHDSADSTYGSPSIIENEVIQALQVPEPLTTTSTPQPLRLSIKSVAKSKTNVNARPNARDSLAGLKFKQSRPNLQQDSINEIPPLPSLPLVVLERRSIDLPPKRNSTVQAPTQAQQRREYATSQSTTNGDQTTNFRDSHTCQETCCNQTQQRVLEQKIASLESSIDTLVPALLGLTQALNGLAAKFDGGVVAGKIKNMPRAPEAPLPTPGTSHSVPSRPVFPTNEFRLDSVSRIPEAKEEYTESPPIFGSVSDREGLYNGEKMADSGRRMSDFTTTMSTTKNINNEEARQSKGPSVKSSQIEDERQKAHEQLTKKWTDRQRQQSCFEPDTSEDELETSEVEEPAERRKSRFSSTIRWSKSMSNLTPSAQTRLAKLSLKPTKSASPLPIPSGPSKTTKRSAPPPPVKIFPIKTAYTARRDSQARSSKSTGDEKAAQSTLEESTQTALSSRPVTSSYTERELSYRVRAPLPAVPQTAGLMQSKGFQDLQISPTQPVALSLPSTPAATSTFTKSAIKKPPPRVKTPPQPLTTRRKSSHSKSAAVPVSNVDPSAQTINKLNARPAWYFFYGAIADPNLLMQLLHLPSPPVLHTARIQSHALKYFGSHPCAVSGVDTASLDVGPRNETRDGMDGFAWYVPSSDMANTLRGYAEQGYYHEVGCELMFLSGTRPIGASPSECGVIGRMFEWQGPADQVTDHPTS